MFRRCCRISPKCVLISILVLVAGSIALTLISNINHDLGQSRSPVDFMAVRQGQGHGMEYQDFHRMGRWEKRGGSRLNVNYDPAEVSTPVEEDHTRNNYNKINYHNRNSKNGRRQAEGVVNLLHQMQPIQSEQPIIKKVFNANLDLLYQAIMRDVDSQGPAMDLTPRCVGNVQEGEVEDLLCIPRPKFLEHIKNPCWYDDSNPNMGEVLRCLPYFHILGCAKAGTTDLWDRLNTHPHLISNDGLLHKEALWWSWRRFGVYGYKKGVPQNFTEYVDLYQDTSRLIQSSLTNQNHYHKVLITGDASPPDFWDFRGWRNMSQNRGLTFPQVLTPQLMKHIYPDPKFILMFKDPIDRLYSDYFFVGGGLTSEDFHRDIVQSVSLLAECVREHDLHTCFYDNKLYYQMKVRLPFGCYSIFMREWLRVFPLKHFLFIKTEDYETNQRDTLKTVMDFLGLHPLKESKLHEITDQERSRITLQKQVAGPMKAKTKAILSRLLNPCSHHLARMIGQPQFVWDGVE